jgi:hypothetical protein
MPDPEDCLPREDEDVLSYALRQSALWAGPNYSGPAIPADHAFLDKAQEDLTAEQRAVVTASFWPGAIGTAGLCVRCVLLRPVTPDYGLRSRGFGGERRSRARSKLINWRSRAL